MLTSLFALDFILTFLSVLDFFMLTPLSVLEFSC
jgi:hypothetical protein